MSAPAATNRRLVTEINKLVALSNSTDSSSVRFILEKSPLDETCSPNSAQNIILGRILPNSNVYNQASFQIEIRLPSEFPFKPPEVRFLTPIYHPNVDENGKICVDLLNSADTWKPTTPLVDVIKNIVELIDNPKIDHALNAGRKREKHVSLFFITKKNSIHFHLEIASEYTSNRSEFERKAMAMLKKHGLPRI